MRLPDLRIQNLRIDLGVAMVWGAALQIMGAVRVWAFCTGRYGWLAGPVLGLPLFAAGSLLLVGGCYLYLRRMAHPARWALLGLLNVPGALAVLILFDDKPPPAGPPGFEVLPRPSSAQSVEYPNPSNPELPSMTIRVKLFAILRERAGVAEVVLDLADGATAASAGEAVFERFPAVRQVGRSVAYAVNRSYVSPATTLRDGDEVALIPPVSGG